MITWGLLSTARINRRLLKAAAETDRAGVVAVASRDAARAQTYAREHGIPKAYGSYEALLEDPEVEAVYISLPNALHVEWTLRGLEAGKHVLCEKPFSRRPEEVRQAFDLADSKHLVLSEAFMWRHHPQTKTLAALLDERVIGRLRIVRAAFGFRLESVHGTGDARLSPQLEGGSLMDVGCYCVNAIRLLAGEPKCVHGEQALGESGVDITFAGTLRCADDVLAHFDCGLVLPDRAALEVVGEGGEASSSAIPGTLTGQASSCGEGTGPRSSSSRSRRRTRIGSSSRMSALRSRARQPRCSGGTMRSARPGRSTPSTGRQTVARDLRPGRGPLRADDL
ncbi:MAG TPA: Gfo/Idh/MocA family oxidoreductase [Gaiellaceae bacterium]|nr:Gfo/Idh/MocA family oxidoreductase [Gaiellaceae bacterium]